MRQLKRLGFVIPLLFLLAVSAALAANNPGHDSLYVLKLGDNVTGNINLTGNLTATLVQATGRFFGPNIDIRGDGSSTANANQIIGTATNLEISSSGNLILNKAVTGGMVYVGWPGTTTALNVTGSIYEGGKRVCLADGTNCPVLGGSSSAGGWTNTTTTTSTALDVNVDSGTLFVNSSSNKVGIGTTTPNATLEIGGSFANGDEYLTLNDGGTDRLAIRKYTNTFVEFYSPSAFYFYAPGAIYKGTGSMSFQLEGGATSTHTFQTWNGNLELKTTGGSGEGFIAFSPKSTEAMRIVNGSRVGINTTAPSGALEVAGALNATSIKVGTVSVCLEDGTNCPASSVAYQSSAAGWTNDSTTTRTALQTIVNSSSSAGSFIVQNQTGSQHLFVDGATGRVGIGTNTLTQRLTVAGGANFTAAGASLVIGNGAEIQLLDMGGYGRIYTVAGNIQSSTSLSMEALNGDYTMTGQYGDVLISAQGRNAAGKGDIAFAASASAYDDTNIVLFLSGSNSRVGISTTAPTQKLDVNGSINVSGTGGTIYVGDSRVCLANGTNCPASSVAYQSSAAGWTNDSATTRTALQTIVNSSSSTGSLIVQNTAGKAHLFINGSSGYAGIGTPSPQTVLMVNGSGTVPTGWPSFSYGQLLIGSQRYDTGPINYTTYLSMGADPTVQTGFIAAINEAWISDSPSYNGGKLALQPTGGGTYTGGALAVGSKSTSTAMLYVNSTVFFPISLLVQNQTGSTHLFVNGTTGFVGVGASSPIASGSIFQVNGVSVFQSGSGGIPAYFYGNGGTSYMQVAVSTTGTGFTSFQPGADYLSFTTTAADFRVSTGSGTPAERLRVTGSGLVGIGTTGPTQKLDVNGSVSINGNIAMPTNFSVGNSAAALGTYAVAIGRSASASNTSTVAIGNGALASGTESVAIGPSADARINTAVALGRVALANGSGAVAIGDTATAFDTAGIAIGGYTRAGGHSLAMTTGATAEGGRGIALGYYSSAAHLGSVALGTAATTTDQNQFMVGNYSYQLNTIIHGTLNTTGNLYENNNRVCTAANGLCAGSVSYQSSAAGWTNDSTSTRTQLQTIINSSSATGSFIVQNTDGTVHMLLNGSNGYIGFGTAAPQGMYEFTGGTDRHLGIEPYWASTSGMAISSYNTGRSGYVPMALNAQRFIFGFGYVGIGTTGPAQALDVNGSIAVVGTTRISSAGVGTFASGTTVNGQNVCLADGTNCPASSVAYQSSAAGWTNTSTNTSTALNVSITGNVTIGSGMSNQSLLFLRATPGVGSEVFNFGNAQMWNQYVLRDRSYTSMMYGIRTGALNIGQSGADATLSWTNNNNNALNLANNVTLQSLYDLILGAGATERMRIKGANIGINTTNPQNTLEVAGTLNASSIKVGTTNVCLSDGTNCPASSTPYQSSAAGWTNDSTTTRTALQTIVNSSSTTGSLIVQNSTGSMHLFVNGSSGLVGLGTTAPAATLDVNGAAVIKSPNAGYQSSMLYIEATGGTSNTYYQIRTESQIGTNFVVTNAGNTGIGTTAPTQKLDVNGSVNITGNITMPSNFWIGKGASATADGAVAIGSNAAATGTNAVVIGAGATAPNRGVAIGSSATATTGWSTAIGNIVSAGTYSVAVGNLANASANDAIAIGMNAQAYSFGTAVGDSAQATASSAAAYGYGASASGAYAAALGASANAVGNYSIATGYMASAPHNYSVAIGANAATTGTNQLVIGSTGQNLNTQVFGILNTTGNLYENNQRVCTAANGLCAGSVSYQSSAAGWTNTSTTTNTTLGVMINTNYAGPYLTVKNSTHNLLIVSAGGLEVNGPLFTIYPDTYSPKGVRAGDIAIGPYSGWGSQSNEILTYGGNIVMQYTTRGNVGIGTNTPTAALHISSSLANGSLHIQNSTGSSHLLVNGSSGNVGIGTTAPTQKLDVNGTVMSRGLHSPTLIANVTGLPYGVDMAVAGRYVYIDSHLSPYNLTIIDVGVPGQPQILSRTSIAQGGRAIAVAGKHAYIGGANVTVVDVSNPTRPVVVGTVSAGACRGLAVAGPYVHCADWLGGFRIFDVTNTSRPVLAKYLGDSAQTQGIAVYGSYAYVGQMTGAASDALFIYNITNPYAATQVANITISGNLAGVAAQDGVVAVISYTASTLVLVNVTNPASPTILKTLALGATPYKVTMSGQYAYVGTASGIKVVDVSDPANAYIQTSIGGGNYERAIAAGQYLYAAGDTFLTYNTGGVVTPGLQASNAEIGQLQVRGDTTVKGALQAGSIIAGAGGMHVQGGDLSVSGNVNVTGTITAGGSIVCTAGNGACAGTGSSSAGGWTNTTTQTSTALNVNVTTGNVTIGNWKISVNETAMKFYVNDTLVQILESDGTLRIKGTIITNDTLA